MMPSPFTSQRPSTRAVRRVIRLTRRDSTTRDEIVYTANESDAIEIAKDRAFADDDVTGAFPVQVTIDPREDA